MALSLLPDGRFGLGDMASFSLSLLFKRLGVFQFFAPAFLIGLFYTFAVSGMGMSTESSEFMARALDPGFLMGAALLALAYMLASWITESYATMCVYGSAFLEARAKPWTASAVMSRLVSKLPGFLGVNLALLMVVFLPTILVMFLAAFSSVLMLMLLFTLPFAIYCGVRLSISPVAYLLEGRSIKGALERSWQLTSESFLYVFGALIGFSIVVGLVTFVLNVLVSVPVLMLAMSSGGLQGLGTLAADPVVALASYVIAYPVSVFSTASMAAFSVVLYMSLVSLKEHNPAAAAVKDMVGGQ